MVTAGQRLRSLRASLGLTIRDVEAASERIAKHHGTQDFAISPSRLSDIEAKGILPNIYRLYSLAVIYRRDIREILAWYGIDVNETGTDQGFADPPKSHISQTMDAITKTEVPVRMDPGFDLRHTVNLERMIERWGVVPVGYLSRFAKTKYTYGFIGSEDFTMYPILLPGSFVQIDETENQIAQGQWRSEYERPIYFVETRTGYTACWCSLKGDLLVLQPHPLSPVAVRMLKYPHDAEVVGQIVGIAMRLNEWRPTTTTMIRGQDEKKESL